MASTRAVSIISLTFMLLAVTSLALSIFFLARNRITFSGGEKASFKDVIGYRYVMATAAVGLLYALLQVPPTVYLTCTGKRVTSSKLAPVLVAYGYLIIAFVLASGVGAGFAVTLDLRKVAHDQGLDTTPDVRSTLNKFFREAYISSGFLFLGFLFVASLFVISSTARAKDAKRGFFFG